MAVPPASVLATRHGKLILLLLGPAIFTGIAAARANSLLAAHGSPAVALTGGFQWALLACSAFLLSSAVIGLRVTSTRGEPPASDDQARELAARSDDQLTSTNRRTSS